MCGCVGVWLLHPALAVQDGTVRLWHKGVSASAGVIPTPHSVLSIAWSPSSEFTIAAGEACAHVPMRAL
jgi:hypothetical protein